MKKKDQEFMKFSEETIDRYMKVYKVFRNESLNEGKKGYVLCKNCIWLPDDFTDEEKITYIVMRNLAFFECATSVKCIAEMFDWSVYRAKKVRKNVDQIFTVSTVFENGGYGGKVWTLNEYLLDELEERYNKLNT